MAPPLVLTPAPSQEQLDQFNFDPQSQTLLRSLGSRHPQNIEVPGQVHGALKEVMSITGNHELPSSCQMEYQTLLDGGYHLANCKSSVTL